MLKVIANQPAIKKYAGQFNKKFKPFIDEKIKVKLGHQGAGFPAKVSWSKNLDIWKTCPWMPQFHFYFLINRRA